MPIGFASGEVLPLKANHLLVKNIDVIGFWWGAYFDHAPAAMAESFTRLLDWAAKGRITPHVSDILPLERSVEALQLIKDRSATGKVAVRVAG
jgi:NADPH2:quinone reductase